MSLLNRASFRIRAVLLALVILLIVCLYGVRLMAIQVVDGSSYAQLAKSRNSLTQTIQAARGEMVDRYGRLWWSTRAALTLCLTKLP